MIVHAPAPVDLLVLGAGWTFAFLEPLLEKHEIAYAATTRDGRDDTIKFEYDPSNPQDDASFLRLPAATTVLITFPLKGAEQADLFVKLYSRTHPDGPPATKDAKNKFHFVLLGATSIWNAPTWSDSDSPYNTEAPRAQAEDALLASNQVVATVLDLAGLYGGQRQPRNWVDRVVKTKEDLKGKGALHLVHGDDVARAIVGVHSRWVKGEQVGSKQATGRRWLVCDLRVYDWWDLVADWTAEDLRMVQGKEHGENEQQIVERATRLRSWVGELMLEEGVRALPRNTERLGRVLDGRSFWEAIGMWPAHGRVR